MNSASVAASARYVKPPPARSRLRTLWRRFWAAPDPDLVDARLRGEWMVASIRLLLVVVVFYFPFQQYFNTPGRGNATVIWMGIGGLVEALVIYSAVMRSWGRGWIGFFSGVLDVTLVSFSLWIFVQIEQPDVVVNDLVIFPVYLLAIGATSLRYDWRVCVLTGSAAVVQYLSMALVLSRVWDVEVSWAQQTGRLLILVMATVLAATLVVRALEQRKLSNRDRLTSLANRGFFDESLMRMGALAARSGEPVAVAMIDIDHFKRFNDTHGHLAGDEALRCVSRLLETSFRTTDLLARYGGEEFAGLFPGLNVQDAGRRLENLRMTIERTPVPIDDRGTKQRVSVSIGVAVWPKDGVNLKETLAIADLRLYQAKQSGRNRVVISAAGESAAAVSQEAQGGSTNAAL